MSSDPILSLDNTQDASALTRMLEMLFEPSEPLKSSLVPSVLLRLTAAEQPPVSYNALIDMWAETHKGGHMSRRLTS